MVIRFRILDLFSGAGGFSYGLDSLEEFETLIATDFNKSALNTFKHNIPKADIILGDITKSEVKEQIINKANELKINMIIGGPPCQGFSNKGKKQGLDDPRNFYF
ncbi:DNA cytosine methyltransferase [Mycoplasmopsis bovis]|uniref:DNA cytosine methyltransferase n=1 Tax=Mycoplasmopsis bovis TaxID=28903 RepID=UPI00287FAD0A|nr:DNA cytosine methyltransferase [Mycoplasmopsis bovis]WNA91353.1 DNA cytosine methyltransferase [Mycoplasmopsis bovis]